MGARLDARSGESCWTARRAAALTAGDSNHAQAVVPLSDVVAAAPAARGVGARRPPPRSRRRRRSSASQIGADGELARYPKVLEYFQQLAKQTDRVRYEQIGKTTMGHPYVLVTISSPENLKRFDAAGGDQPAAGRSARR